ncbi:MAG: hypothetical protein IPM07_30735 [Anaerolineales bacterium]|nr:hypothetical protein [Anaerolineales bacterium]
MKQITEWLMALSFTVTMLYLLEATITDPTYQNGLTARYQAREQTRQVQAQEWGDTLRTWGMWGGGGLAAVGGLVVVAWAVVQWQEQRTRRHEATEDHTTQRLRITTQKEIAVAYIALYRDREPDARFMRLADGTAGVYLPNENELVTIDACRAELATAQTTALTRRTPPTINVPGAPQERRFLVLGDLEQEDI